VLKTKTKQQLIEKKMMVCNSLFFRFCPENNSCGCVSAQQVDDEKMQQFHT
jgi:hypothetical protein